MTAATPRTRPALAKPRKVNGKWFVFWGDRPLCDKPECSKACAKQTCAWLNGLPAAEFRCFVECSR